MAPVVLFLMMIFINPAGKGMVFIGVILVLFAVAVAFGGVVYYFIRNKITASFIISFVCLTILFFSTGNDKSLINVLRYILNVRMIIFFPIMFILSSRKHFKISHISKSRYFASY